MTTTTTTFSNMYKPIFWCWPPALHTYTHTHTIEQSLTRCMLCRTNPAISRVWYLLTHNSLCVMTSRPQAYFSVRWNIKSLIVFLLWNVYFRYSIKCRSESINNCGLSWKRCWGVMFISLGYRWKTIQWSGEIRNIKSGKMVRKMWMDVVRKDGRDEWENVNSQIKPVHKTQIFSIQNSVVLHEWHSIQSPC